jgi:hypothetical protein
LFTDRARPASLWRRLAGKWQGRASAARRTSSSQPPGGSGVLNRHDAAKTLARLYHEAPFAGARPDAATGGRHLFRYKVDTFTGCTFQIQEPVMTQKQRLIYSIVISLVVLGIMLGLSYLQNAGMITEKMFQYIAIGVAVTVVIINGVMRRKVKP